MSYKSSLVELPLFGTYWVYEHVYNLGNHLVIQSRIVKNVTYIYLSWLACTEFRLVPYSPACDLRTPGLTYITPQSSLHSVPYTDIREFKIRRLRTTDYEPRLDERCPLFVALGSLKCYKLLVTTLGK